MAGSLNKVMIIGHLGKDPEKRSFSNGGAVVNFSVACSESWKDKSTGERREKTEWVNVAVFNDNLGGIAMQYLKKGSKVYVEGKLQTRKWQDNSGSDRYSTEVVLQGFDGTILMLSKTDDAPAQGGYGGTNAKGRNDMGAGASSGHTGGGGGFGHNDEDLDDDVPFITSSIQYERRAS